MKWLKRIGIVLLLLVALVFAAGWLANEPRPTGTLGPEADALAKKVAEAANVEAWEKTGAVWWNYAGRNVHLWDRRRGFARVRSGDVEVLLDLSSRSGRVTRAGVEVTGPEKAALLDKGYRFWVNDSFWLNPLAKLFDEGVTRSIVKLEDGREALLISYAEGGVTPGDAYLWFVGEDGLPTAWKMWVGILPIGGIEVSWDRWKTLSTGAKIATLHESFVAFELTDVLGAPSVDAIETEDPFAPLVQGAASRPAEE